MSFNIQRSKRWSFIVTTSLFFVCLTQVSCGLLIDKALEDSDHGEVCETQEDCKEGLICVQAVEVDPGQEARLGYRCMQGCQRASQCTESRFHTSCCQMTYENETFSACFDDQEMLCGQTVEAAK